MGWCIDNEWEIANLADNYKWFDDDDDDDNGQDQLPEPARKAMRQLAKRVKELEKENGELKTTQRRSKLGDLVKAKGFIPEVAGFIPNDLNDDDAVNKWLDEKASLFAKADTEETNEGKAPAAPEVEDEDVMGMANLQAAMSQMTPQAGTQANLAAQINNTTSKDELDKLIASTLSKATIARAS